MHREAVTCPNGHDYFVTVTRGAGGPPETRFAEPDEYDPETCPVCGDDPDWIETTDEWFYTAQCNSCGMRFDAKVELPQFVTPPPHLEVAHGCVTPPVLTKIRFIGDNSDY
jgi:rubredoxin